MLISELFELYDKFEWDAGSSKSGSIIAYHGTPMKNVESIIKNGFNKPNFYKPLTTGEQFGQGIYLADDPHDAGRFGGGLLKVQFTGRYKELTYDELVDISNTPKFQKHLVLTLGISDGDRTAAAALSSYFILQKYEALHILNAPQNLWVVYSPQSLKVLEKKTIWGWKKVKTFDLRKVK